MRGIKSLTLKKAHFQLKDDIYQKEKTKNKKCTRQFSKWETLQLFS